MSDYSGSLRAGSGDRRPSQRSDSNGDVNGNPYARVNDATDNPYARAPAVNGINPYARPSSNPNENPYARPPSSSSDNPYARNANNLGSGPRPSFQPRSGRRPGAPGAENPYTADYGASHGSTRDDRENTNTERAGEKAQVARPTSLERKQANRRSGGSPWSQRSPTRRPQIPVGDGSRQVEEVLSQIKKEWSFMTSESCVPVQVSLQLMDSSSLGLAGRYRQFQDVHSQLQTSLKAIVNEHHQGFNSSIGTYHNIQAAIHTSQLRLRGLRESLLQAKASLGATKPELRGLAAQSRDLDDMLQSLVSIQYLQSIPEKLEAQISEKRFLAAVDLLQDALRSMRRSELDNVEALNDLRLYLNSQEHSLTDILVEELHNHLYLKSPYVEHRWKQYSHSSVTNTTEKPNGINLSGRKLFAFLDRLDCSKPMQESSGANIEADTFQYIRLVLEALNKLGRLEDSIEMITQRLPVEMFKIVEKCNQEVDNRYPSGLRTASSRSDPLDLNGDSRMPVLNDLLDRLYARFETIAEGHRAVHEVITGIAKREGTRTSPALIGSFKEVWKLYQSEIRSLLHDYLATDGASHRNNQKDRTRSVFNRQPREKGRRVFKLMDVDAKASELAAEREDLDFILKSSVPGLVLDSKRPDGSVQTNGIHGNGEDGNATGHKLLVEASVFNMGILLPPSLAFLRRLREVVPPTADIAPGSLTSFLDDFLLNVFLPQLEETLVDLSSQAFSEADTFQKEPQWRKYSRQPISKGAVRFYRLLTAFCRLLDRLPHDQAFSQLLIGQMITFYDKSYSWFKAVMTRPQLHTQTGSQVKIAAALTDSGAVHDVLNDLLEQSVTGNDVLIHKETELLLQTFEEVALQQADTVNDKKAIASLCLLHTSMKWLANRLNQLRFISSQSSNSANRDHGARAPSRRWTVVANVEAPMDRVYLPLSMETASDFDNVTTSYQQLASTILRVLHVDLRAQIYITIAQALTRSFDVDQPFTEPDPEVLALNQDVIDYDETYSSHLIAAEHSFLTKGLAHFIDDLIVRSTAQQIDVMNQNGCGRLQLDILVLQQNLKNVEADATLTKSALYLDLFAAGPDAIILHAKEQGKPSNNSTQPSSEQENEITFNRQEMEKLLGLWHSADLRSERREVQVQAKRNLDDHVLQLSEHIW